MRCRMVPLASGGRSYHVRGSCAVADPPFAPPLPLHSSTNEAHACHAAVCSNVQMRPVCLPACLQLIAKRTLLNLSCLPAEG
jgi:hypothetical protein